MASSAILSSFNFTCITTAITVVQKWESKFSNILLGIWFITVAMSTKTFRSELLFFLTQRTTTNYTVHKNKEFDK